VHDPAFIGCRTVKGDCPALEEYLSLLGARPRNGVIKERTTQLATVCSEPFRIPGLLRASGLVRSVKRTQGDQDSGVDRSCGTDLLSAAECVESDCSAPADPTPGSDCSLQTPKPAGWSWPGWACCGASPLKSRANSLLAASGSNGGGLTV